MVEPMDDFERELREQLQTRAAPGGFAERVMARIPPPRPSRWFWQPAWRWAVVAAVAGAMVAGGLEREHERRMEGERARNQVLLALRITGSTLREVQQKVNSEPQSTGSSAGAVVTEP